jgi:hypothetical protein
MPWQSSMPQPGLVFRSCSPSVLEALHNRERHTQRYPTSMTSFHETVLGVAGRHRTASVKRGTHLKLWARVFKQKESATFEYDQAWLQHPARFSLEPALQPWSRPVSHAGRYSDVRRYRRLGAGPLGTDADAPHGPQARGTGGRGSSDAPGNRLSAACGR